jgi:hypothetical protein
MESSQVKRVLIVANRTAATPDLLEHIKRLARERPSAFLLLIPDAPTSEHTDSTMELALKLLERAAGGRWRVSRARRTPSRRFAERSPAGTTTRSCSRRCRGASRSGCGGTCRATTISP